jgi:CheY-like chemotaxis protein
VRRVESTTGSPSTAPGELAAASLKVLVIEDTIPVQKLLARWLTNHGCSVQCANNGKVGLELLQSRPFDITFVDFLMVRGQVAREQRGA